MLHTLCHILQCWLCCCCVSSALTAAAAPSAWGGRRRCHPSEEIGPETRRGRTRCQAERVRPDAEGLAGTHRQVASAGILLHVIQLSAWLPSLTIGLSPPLLLLYPAAAAAGTSSRSWPDPLPAGAAWSALICSYAAAVSLSRIAFGGRGPSSLLLLPGALGNPSPPPPLLLVNTVERGGCRRKVPSSVVGAVIVA